MVVVIANKNEQQEFEQDNFCLVVGAFNLQLEIYSCCKNVKLQVESVTMTSRLRSARFIFTIVKENTEEEKLRKFAD